MKRTRWVRWSLVLLAFAGTAWAAPPSYRLTELEGFTPQALNNLGQIAGNGPGGAVLYSNGSLTTLGGLGGGFVDVNGLNDLGQVVGEGRTSTGATHAFLWRDGAMQDLGTLGGSFSTGAAINNSGWVTGTSRTSSGGTSTFLYDGSTMVDLGATFPTTPKGAVLGSRGHAINEAGHVSGAMEVANASGFLAYLYADGVLHDLSDDRGFGFALDLNDRGQAVGRDNCCYAFLYDNGSFTRVDSADGDYLDIGGVAINERGQALFETYGRQFSSSTPLLYEDGALHEVSNLLHASDRDVYILQPYDMNDAGQIIAAGVPRDEVFGGTWFGDGPQSYYLLSPIPEPGTYALMLAGLLALALRGVRWRRIRD